MTQQYRYKLDPSPKKFICPSCGKKKFVRYLDTHTHDYLPEKYGRCDREIKCAYVLNPYKDGYAKSIQQQDQELIQPIIPIKKQIKTTVLHPIPEQVLSQTLSSSAYSKNTFIQNLLHRVPFPFDPEDIEKIIGKYYLGTIAEGYMKGAVTFPFIDKSYQTRAIQVKAFDKTNHTLKTSFLHKIIESKYHRKGQQLPEWLEKYLQNEKIVSCLFGEHLLEKYPKHIIALVEAPKTAIYATLYYGFPEESINQFLWLAVYNLSSLNYEKCKVLQGRQVVLFPDLSSKGTAYQKWQTKAQELNQKMPGTAFVMSDLLEKYADQAARANGFDLADYLIQLDWRKFRKCFEVIQAKF